MKSRRELYVRQPETRLATRTLPHHSRALGSPSRTVQRRRGRPTWGERNPGLWEKVLYLQHFISKQEAEALHPLVATLDLAKPGQFRLFSPPCITDAIARLKPIVRGCIPLSARCATTAAVQQSVPACMCCSRISMDSRRRENALLIAQQWRQHEIRPTARGSR